MQAVEILPDLFFIERGYLNGNHFVYRSEKAVLIDTGYVADFDVTAELIHSLGVRLEGVRLIISTHTHCDHIGGNHLIQQRSGCDIALHRIGKHFIETRDDWSTWWRYYHQEADFFHCSHALNDSDRVSVGPYEFEVIYTPGHASDGIVLYNRTQKVLISSDTLWENDMAVITTRVEGSTAPYRMLESLEKLESLEVKMVYPGHGPAFADMCAAIGRSKKRLQGFLANRELIGQDILKKIIIYTLLMRRSVHHAEFFGLLMRTNWFKETVDLYFGGQYQALYDQIMEEFMRRGLVKINNGLLSTTVRP
jgi:glyoxylase-like metal-dependent hydrolase (beta-lactamase superfamily II)